MNLGTQICALRRTRQITQEQLAAELGVTAAAVSKWEHGYTLPDILMLCALADYFEVTTDELLGRSPYIKYAVVAVSVPELGEAIQALIKRHGFQTRHIYLNYAEALEAAKSDPSVTHLFSSFDQPMCEEERGETEGIICIESHAVTTQQILDGFEIYFRNKDALDAIARNSNR